MMEMVAHWYNGCDNICYFVIEYRRHQL